MRCPFCSFEGTRVKDSRTSEQGHVIRRRRYCPACHARFTTFERVQLRPLQIEKRDGTRQEFDREKLYRSIAIACRKRPIDEEQLEDMVSTIQRQLERLGDNPVPSKVIGGYVMDMLRSLDHVAYVRFASVYLDFTAISDFRKTVMDLEKKRERDSS